MPGKRCLALSLVLILAAGAAVAAEGENGVVAGWNPNNGRVLLSELKCAACHDPGDQADFLGQKEAPNLAQVGARVTPQYLRKFLANPHATKPGTTMPNVMHGQSDAQRAENVEMLVHYLASRGGPIDQRASGARLGEIARGRELFHTVGCVACHAPQEPPPKHRIDASLEADDEDDAAAKLDLTSDDSHPSVPLPPLAMKTTVDELASFLHDPLKIRPSGRMPSLSLQPGEGRSIAAYLLRAQYTDDQRAPGSGVGFAFYNGKFNSAKDLAEAKPSFEGELPQIDLQKALAAVPTKDGKPPNSNFGVRFFGLLETPADGKYRFWTRSDDGTILSINGEVVVNNDGNHPPREKDGTIELRKGRHQFDLAFTQGGGGFEMAVQWQPPGAKQLQPIAGGVLLNQAAAMIPVGIADFQVDPAKAERGRKLFAALRCASCHETGEELEAKSMAPPLAKLNPAQQRGCLSAKPGGDAARYDLTAKQIHALRGSLQEVQSQQEPASPAQQLRLAMTTMNCYACHQRGETGGPGADRADYFVYERVVDLGDEGRLPPPLHDVGAKLTRDGFSDMLFHGHKYRTYMATRMPQFGKENVGDLVGTFEQLDAGKVPAHEPEFSPRHVDDGRFLVGSKALSCINCHAWGEHRLPGAEGMDLLQTTRRLKPSWFHAWLKDPQTMRPGTRMPSAWPQGQTFFKDIQGGDVDAQIDAIWAYLSVGEKGGYPPGLSPDDDSLLVPADEPMVFRTFLNKISAHAILVGFRQRTHMAFDANRIRTAAVWTGSFITTKPVWDGRAGQYAKIPSNDIVYTPEGPAFATLESDTTPWPEDVPKKNIGSNRTPEGWEFRGYRLDENRVPTFLYNINQVRVEETPGTRFLRELALLRREFQMSADDPPENLFFRAAVGEKIESKGGTYVVDDKLQFTFDTPESVQPFVREVDGRQELLFPVQLTKGSGGKHQMEFAVEMTW